MIEKNAPPLRSEQEIFADLHALCTQPGFVHVLAYVCFRDNMVFYNEDVTVEHLREVFGPDKLIRTEITTLLGLMVKAPVDWTVPAREVQQTQLEASERLLLELHQVLSAAWNLGAAAADVQVVYVTVDPDRDDLNRIRQYLGAFDASFIGGTETPAKLAEMRKRYGVVAEKIPKPQPNAYGMNHSTSVFLIDRAGKLKAMMPYGHPAQDFVHDLKLLLASK